ncbi:DUF4255 domain-containing protein [Coleofasciculus sp. LEGE 07092]|nr:DUF4255 domain-containing protein [Coleofasciculus sp. LEGE 07081]MBE9150338.1 DUF4255 domain-containing protein [Coleofasciculus sp. LEGE 07092]
MQQTSQKTETLTNRNNSPLWFDVSFVVTCWDYTALGEQYPFSEALTLLLCHPLLPEGLLAPALRGYGMLPIEVSTSRLIDAVALWNALEVPFRPALYVTVTVPFSRHREPLMSQKISLTSTE